MNNCPSCGHERSKTETRCPACGAFYPTIAELLAEEEAYEAAHSWRGRWQKIWGATDRKQAVLEECKQFWTGLSLTGKFSLFVIFVFVFALIVTVL
jgi:hypothetical protein